MSITSANKSAEVRAMIYFSGGPTGIITVASINETAASYEYMPLRNLPHLELGREMRVRSHAEVSVRLKSGTITMIATALSARSITLTQRASA